MLLSEVTFCNFWRKIEWEQNMESVFPENKKGLKSSHHEEKKCEITLFRQQAPTSSSFIMGVQHLLLASLLLTKSDYVLL
jgi:hypothetical protein